MPVPTSGSSGASASRSTRRETSFGPETAAVSFTGVPTAACHGRSLVHGASLDEIYRMTFDGGTLYVTDLDHSGRFPGTSGSSRRPTAAPRGRSSRSCNGPVLGLAALNGLVYAGGELKGDAFLGGSTRTTARKRSSSERILAATTTTRPGVAVDKSGNVVVVVETYSADYPST